MVIVLKNRYKVSPVLLLVGWIILASAHAEVNDAKSYIEQSLEKLRTATINHRKTWGFGKANTWSVDQKKGLIRFNFSNGKVVTAPVQIIGTYADNGTFMWSWDHPSVEAALNKHASLVKQFGKKHKLQTLLIRTVKISEKEAWKYTALAMRLGNASGAYRAKSGKTWIYMTFGKVSVSKVK